MNDFDVYSFAFGVIVTCSFAFISILIDYMSLRFPIGFFGKSLNKKSLKKLKEERERIDDLIIKKEKELDKDE